LPAGVLHRRFPIRDHGIPREPAEMIEILDFIHEAVRSQRPLYVHCHAGIGRTGTVAGCWLVEQGLPGERALDELNRLWQQSERSQRWPRVPETPEQIEYVRGWVQRPRPER
jgi:protein-tyrosine phosphatase